MKVRIDPAMPKHIERVVSSDDDIAKVVNDWLLNVYFNTGERPIYSDDYEHFARLNTVDGYSEMRFIVMRSGHELVVKQRIVDVTWRWGATH